MCDPVLIGTVRFSCLYYSFSSGPVYPGSLPSSCRVRVTEWLRFGNNRALVLVFHPFGRGRILRKEDRGQQQGDLLEVALQGRRFINHAGGYRSN
jgi:hypothetical protein